MMETRKTIPKRFKPNPALAISGILIRLLAKITALVPVPEGNIKAKEHAKVAGIMKSSG